MTNRHKVGCSVIERVLDAPCRKSRSKTPKTVPIGIPKNNPTTSKTKPPNLNMERDNFVTNRHKVCVWRGIKVCSLVGYQHKNGNEPVFQAVRSISDGVLRAGVQAKQVSKSSLMTEDYNIDGYWRLCLRR